MTAKTLTCQTTGVPFPEGTIDPGFTFTVTGTLPDGAPFSSSITSQASSEAFDLGPGTYTGTVSKLGFSSLPSAALVITVPVTITLSVPDATQAASFV